MSQKTFWPSEIQALLGTVPDKIVAKQLGVSIVTVHNKRKKLGVPSYLGFKWTSEMDALLGTAVDWKIAEQLGVSDSTVHYRRKTLNIPRYQKSKKPKKSRKPRKPRWTPFLNSLLGAASDQKVASKLGVSHWTIRKRRQQLGIPTWRSQSPSRNTRTQQVRNLPNTLTWKQWWFAVEYFDKRCAYCNKKCYLTQDHLIPVVKGGGYTALNIIPACWPCNNSKHAQQANPWILKHFGVERGKEIIAKIQAYLTEVRSNYD